MFFASLKHSPSTSNAYASIKSSSPSSESVVSFDSCCFLDLYWRRSLEKRPRICMLDSHSVLSNILSPSIVQAVCISFATWFGSCFLSRPILNFRVKPDVFRKMDTCTPLMKSPSHGKLWSTCHCSVTVQSLKLYRVKAVDGLQSFSNTIRHQSINELCLNLSLCKCYKWMLNKARNQTKIFRRNRSLTTPRSQLLFKSLNELPLEPQTFLTKSSCTCSSYSTGLQFFEIQSTIDQRAHQ